jgi:SOS response regulatory protein OraA/RecX
MVDNKNINENEENIIPTAEDVRTCADAALVLIRFSANSRKMLEDKLIKKGFSRDVVKIALDNLEKGGFIFEEDESVKDYPSKSTPTPEVHVLE